MVQFPKITHIVFHMMHVWKYSTLLSLGMNPKGQVHTLNLSAPLNHDYRTIRKSAPADRNEDVQDLSEIPSYSWKLLLKLIHNSCYFQSYLKQFDVV